jgi:hypothetical protein
MKFATFVPYVKEEFSDEKLEDGYILIQEGANFDRIEHKSKEDFQKYLEDQGINVKKF